MKKRIVLLLHGFMIHDRHDIRFFKSYVDKHEFEDTDFELVYIYDRTITKSSSPKVMEKKIIELVKEYQTKYEDVILAGYSFSCGLAAKVSHVLKLKKVIYFAPAVRLLKSGLLKVHAKNAFKTLKLKMKHGNKKANKIMERTKIKGVVPLSIHICFSMMRNRKYYKSDIPFILYRGQSDTYSLSDDVNYICKKSTANNFKYVTGTGRLWDHFFIYNEELMENEIVNHLRYFIEGNKV